MSSLDILIAEDNPKDYEFLEQLLSQWQEKVTVTRAPTGLAALEIGATRPQPLVISDIQMPEMNGIEFARQLWSKQPRARIVFWSQFKDEMYVRTLVKIVPPETVYGYVLKSATRVQISSAIRTVLIEEQYWIAPEARKVQGRAGHSLTALSDIEYEALLDISLGLTDNLIAQRRYLSRRGIQSRLNSLYNKLGLDQEQFHSEKFGDSFNLRNRAVAVSLARGLINAFEMENEEKDFQEWFTRYKRSQKGRP